MRTKRAVLGSSFSFILHSQPSARTLQAEMSSVRVPKADRLHGDVQADCGPQDEIDVDQMLLSSLPVAGQESWLKT